MLPRFRHLLVPLDFTGKNRAALDVAVEIATQNRARVTLFHVIETVDGVDDEDMRPFFDRLERRAEAELESLAQPFAAAGLAVDRKIRFGHRAAAIVQDTIEREVDLIVMSSHPIDPAHPMRSFGTVSYQVSVLCRCPILLVK